MSVPLLLRLPLAGGRGQAYDLCSVVVHSGLSSESGHYYCYAREGAARPAPALGAAERPEPDNQWYLFNDTRVSFSSFESVSNVTSFFPKDTAYVLFYRQRPEEGPEAEPGSPRPRAEPTLHKDLMEAISKDNHVKSVAKKLSRWVDETNLSVTQSCPTLKPHALQYTRLPSPSPTPGPCSCPSRQ